jgi:acetoin utilization protein AcuB
VRGGNNYAHVSYKPEVIMVEEAQVDGSLVGIVAEGDLLYASPSPVTSLNMWEIHSLLAKLKVDKVMTRKVITIQEDIPIEEAARIMVENKIGGLPVMRGKALAGIITESDLFKIFISLLGGRRHGVRLSATVSGKKGTFAKITRAIAEAGGDIVGLGFNEMSIDPEVWVMTVKVQEITRTKLMNTLRPVVKSILDVREM